MEKVIDFIVEYFKVIISLLFLTLLFAFVSSIQPIGSSLIEKNKQQGYAIEQSYYSSYNGTIVAGNSVVNASNKFSKVLDFYIYIEQNGSVYGIDIGNNGNTCYIPDPSLGMVGNSRTFSCSFGSDSLKDESLSTYIKYTDTFKAILLTNSSNRVVGIYFKKT